MKLRITILIILTLLLGFAIGMLTSAQLRHKRMRPIRIYASENYFKDHLYKVVEPDSAQKAELDAIIERYGEEFNEMNAAFWKDFETLMDRQWNDIKPVLNKEQIEKLQEIERNRREKMKEFRQKDRSEDHDFYDRRRPDRDRRSPGSRGSLPNPQDRKTDNL
ncbi:MAG: hypothetical protein U9N72_00425 [Bacteroidota bacterium]|nr:hypothetical protein [Bacteroidota bacterium]